MTLRIRQSMTAAAVSAAVIAAFAVVVPSAAAVAACPPASVAGKPIGWIEFAKGRVPITPVHYPAGGVLNPPPTNLAAGVSTRHQPLLAQQGSTVIAWHVRYGVGCDGALNPIVAAGRGGRFTVVLPNGPRQTYVVTEAHTVSRGKYRPEWFRLNGDPQITMLTCSDLRNGTFTKTSALIAVPIPT